MCRDNANGMGHYRMLSNADETKFDSAPAGARRVAHAVEWLRAALPQACALCAAPSGSILVCAACAADMPRIAAPCPRCALPTFTGEICGACLASPPAHDATIAAWRYAFPADRLLQAFKYGGRLELAEPLAQALAEAVVARRSPLPERLVALPLSARRQRIRGFNQAQEIARRVGACLGIPLEAGLVRVVDAPPQAGLARMARARNVRGAFTMAPRCDARTFAIIDDVMTTGATLAGAAAALRAAGATRVEAWVVARTLPRRGSPG